MMIPLAAKEFGRGAKLCLRLTSLIMAIGLLSEGLQGQDADEWRQGRLIIQAWDESNRCRDERTALSMDIVDARGRRRRRKLYIATRRDEDGNLSALIRFTWPRDVKRTGLLTVDNSDRDADQWLYLPILRKIKRIPASGKTGNFVGTDFAFEDLRPEDLGAHKYRLLGKETVEGQECYVVEAFPASKSEERNSSYGRRKLWIRADVHLKVKVAYYNKDGKHVKTETASEITKTAEGIWRANYIRMENHEKGHSTTIRVMERTINEGVPRRMFTTRELERGE